MKSPTTLFYFNRAATCGLLERLDEEGLTNPNPCKDPGAISGLGKTMVGLFDPKRSSSSNTAPRGKAAAELELLADRLAPGGGTVCLPTLEQAFRETPAGEARLVDVEDRFLLANSGTAIEHRLFVFLIPPSTTGDYNEAEQYFQQGTRSWSVTLAANCECCRGGNNPVKVVAAYERFRACGNRDIPLRVVGCFMRWHRRAQVLPFAIWV